MPLDRKPPRGFASSAGLAALGIVLAGATRLGYSVLVGRSGGPELLGPTNAGIALATVATMLGPLALGSAASKFLARALARGGPTRQVVDVWQFLLRRVLGLTALLAVLGGAAGVVLLDLSPVAAASVGVLILALALAAVTRGAAFGTGRIGVTVYGEITNAVISLVLLTFALLGGLVTADQPTLVLVPLALGSFGYAIITWPRLRRAASSAGPTESEPDVEADPRRDVDAFVGWGVLGNVASAGLLHLSLITAAAWSDASAGSTQQVGLYAAAVALGTPVAALAQPLAQVLFPRLAAADARNDAGAVRKQTDLATRVLILIMVPAIGAVVALAQPLLVLVYGPDFADGAQMLRIVAITVLFSTITVPAVASLTSGRPSGIRTTAILAGGGLVVGTIVAAVAVPTLGVVGAAMAYAVGSTTLNSSLWCQIWRQQHQHWVDLTARLLGAAAVMLVVTVLGPLSAGGLPVDLAVAAGFVGAWLAVSLTDLRRVLSALRPR
ncbi:MAG TPA: lipopolysaccharide biosynthesis protein [Nakamurella multipartita]|nr:lipopolysaccharide biosynthesis protein [Nakamurella multipartita]